MKKDKRMQENHTYPTGRRIEQARTEADITKIEMSRVLNVSRQTYDYLENGQVDPRFLVLQKIAHITNKPLGFFYDCDVLDAQEQIKLKNACRHEGMVYACLKLAELYNEVELAVGILDTIGVDIKRGRPKDAEKLKLIIAKRKS